MTDPTSPPIQESEMNKDPSRQETPECPDCDAAVAAIVAPPPPVRWSDAVLRRRLAWLRVDVQTFMRGHPGYDDSDGSWDALELIEQLRAILAAASPAYTPRKVEGDAARQLDQHSTALVNLTAYVGDLRAAVEALMTALHNPYHPAYTQGRAALDATAPDREKGV